MSLEEEEIKKGFLEEGESEVGLQVKRHRLALPGASLGTFSFYPHNSNLMIIIVMIIPISQIRTLRPGQGKSFTQSSTARKPRSWDLLLKSMLSPALPKEVFPNSLRM